MKFKVNSADLVSMLKVAIKGFDSRDESSFVYMKVEDNKLSVISRCRPAFFMGQVSVENLELDQDEPSVYYVEGEVLKRLASIFPTAPVKLEFEVNKDSRAFSIKYTGNRFKLPIVSDTAEIAHPVIRNLGIVQGQEFMNVVNMLVKIVDNDPSLQEHPSSCLHLIFSKDEMKSMGTDRFAIAEMSREFSGSEELEGIETILIKHPQAALLSKTSGPAELLKVVYSDEYFGYIDSEGFVSLVARTDINPLNYEQIKMNTGSGQHVVLETSDLREALGTIAKLSFAYDQVMIELDNEEKTCKVSSVTGDSISIQVKEMELDAQKVITFTRSILSEALSPVTTEELRLQWSSEGASVFQIIPVDDGEDEEGIFIGVVPNATT